jgi:hypothetical protein
MAFATLASTLLVIVVVGFALAHGQQIKTVTSDGDIEFYSTGDRVPEVQVAEQVEAAQSDLQADTRALQQQADAVADSTDSQLPDIAGRWSGENGLEYYIYQYGDQVVMQEVSDIGVTAAGSGIFDGTTVQLEYQAADWSTGYAELTLEDPSRLSGYFYNYDAGTSVPASLRR